MIKVILVILLVATFPLTLIIFMCRFAYAVSLRLDAELGIRM